MVGGLIASTLLAMFLMPAFYLLIRRRTWTAPKRPPQKAQPEPVEAGNTQS